MFLNKTKKEKNGIVLSFWKYPQYLTNNFDFVDSYKSLGGLPGVFGLQFKVHLLKHICIYEKIYVYIFMYHPTLPLCFLESGR